MWHGRSPTALSYSPPAFPTPVISNELFWHPARHLPTTMSSPPPFLRPHLNLGYGNDHQDGINTLPELIEFAALHNPHHTFGWQLQGGGRREINFVQLRAAVEGASEWLVTSGTTPGRRRREHKVGCVAILLGSDVGIFFYLAALLRIGTPALLISARLSPVAIAHLFRETSPGAVLVCSQTALAARNACELLEGMTAPLLVDAPSYDTFLHLNGAPSSYAPRYTESQYGDLDAVILHSSGTTGLPKPIHHAHAFLLLIAAAHRLPEQEDPFPFSVLTLPLYHGFGLIAPMLSLSIGMPFILPPPSVIPTAKTTLQTLQTTGARYLFSVPSTIEDILSLPGDTGLSILRTLEIVVVGGAAIKENVGEKLAFEGVRLLTHWGASEIGPIAPIERTAPGYDWRYFTPRTDMDLRFLPADNYGESGTYTLISRPPGWENPYTLQDLLQPGPRCKEFRLGQYKILGRTDNVLVLANGEKVSPAAAERVMAEHPNVKDVLAFGEGQFSVGLLIELRAHSERRGVHTPGEVEGDKDGWGHPQGIGAYLDRANLLLDKHGKVARELVVFTSGRKPLLRTDKGSLARKANYAAFAEEIRDAYEKCEAGMAIGRGWGVGCPAPGAAGGLPTAGAALRDHFRWLVKDVTGVSLERDEEDLFEAGMDSLQAARLRSAILRELRMSRGIEELEPDFCFENSSVEKMAEALCRLMGGRCGATGDAVGEDRRIGLMKEMVGRYQDLLAEYASLVPDRKGVDEVLPSRGFVIVLTGSTGSLGCFLLARLAKDPAVSKIICLNRRSGSGSSILRRQLDALEKRGADVGQGSWSKITLREADLAQPNFGLGKEDWEELAYVTHIIHNAWPVNFSRHLLSFEPHVKTLCNLIRLCFLNARTERTRILFTSSIAVASHYPSSGSSIEVPEASLDAAHSAPLGYTEAKWVCEKLIEAANERYGAGDKSMLRASTVRLGQITGAVNSGAWNEMEHIPLIVQTSQVLGALPNLEGSASWVPVDLAGDVIVDLLFSSTFSPVYHLENPCRRPWSSIIHELADLLGGAGSPLPLIPYKEWIDHVRSCDEVLPATQIVRFLEGDFVRLGLGRVKLIMDEAKRDSQTLRELWRNDPFVTELLLTSVGYWRRLGVLV